MCQALAFSGCSMYWRNFQDAACWAGSEVLTMKKPLPPGWTCPEDEIPGNGADAGSSPLGSMPDTSTSAPTSAGVRLPARADAMLTDAPDVSISIDDSWAARAMYWSTPPSVLANTFSRPSSSILRRSWRMSTASGLLKVALVALPSRPLLLFTTSTPSPLNQFSSTALLTLNETGLGMPAALSFFAVS